MKATGIVRRIDDLGRVVIPKELRNTLGIKEGDPLEFFMDGDRVVLKKYEPGCYLCGNVESELQVLYDRPICLNCITVIGQHADKIKESLSPATK
ncbi:AbrB/MazE/SpoVT family DNA-binding domain-containing protein [Paenibacillus sp. USDA918EY]|uniref:AbrB/MazE/SpoVT family DNA-binding domain-containing protein n=1 Tax=Paenibacillus sp. USDA918EY TaxID=2689575 RepID=UPI00135B25D7|nr:AbrB/MazE/SpoVT family DNA-binding domain-containing protein [Paenibacillus sp. USDA918EY]